MCDTNQTEDRSPEPTVLALAPVIEQLTEEIHSLVAQLVRLYEQRHFELQQKYGQQTFLDFQQQQPQHHDGFKPSSSPPSK